MARSGVLGRGLDLLEERAGVRVIPEDQAAALHESVSQLEVIVDEAQELGWFDYLGGNRPQEMRPEKRNRLAQRSRTALRDDPLAGAEANLLANFSFGSGIGKPRAANERVQEVIDEAWTDAVNAQKLTGFEAQRHRSYQLLTDANLLPLAFIRGGRVRLGFLDPDIVHHVVTDPEDDERPLYYVARKRKIEWDFQEHREKTPDEAKDAGPMAKVIYYPHWRNVEDAEKEREENGEEPLEKPSEEDLAEGLVEHVRINRIGRTQWGTPPWARTLRFFSAMNTLTEAHVAMAQARSTWIAKQTMAGSPRQIVDRANAVLAQTGEIAAATFSTLGGDPDVEGRRGRPVDPRDPRNPPASGSLWMENESSKLESLNLSSGAAEAAQTAQIVRAPISAAANFQQGYFGDAQNAGSLAAATALELPSLMNVSAWQETFEQVFRWFVDLVIQEAVRSGRLGGLGENEGGGKMLHELRLSEAEDKQEMERRTGLDLSYSFEMPYPGRRNLPDVVSAVTTIPSSFDPQGQNIPLRRALLYFFAKDGLQHEDPSKFIDEVLPEGSEPIGPAQPQFITALGQYGGGNGTTPGGDGTASQYGEGRTGGAANPQMGEAFLPEEMVGPLGRLEAEEEELFRRTVREPAVLAAVSANGSEEETT